MHENGSDKARTLLVEIGKGKHEAHIPELAWYEVLGVLTRHITSETKVQQHINQLSRLVESGAIQSHTPNTDLLNAAAEMAFIDTKSQGHISSYDATFHALAVQLEAIFITADEKHYRKTKDTVGSIILLDDVQL